MAARFIAISLVTKRAGVAACLVTVVTKCIVATKRAAADNPFRHVYIYKETKAFAFSEISCRRFHEFPARGKLESVSYKTCSPCCYRFCTINRCCHTVCVQSSFVLLFMSAIPSQREDDNKAFSLFLY